MKKIVNKFKGFLSRHEDFLLGLTWIACFALLSGFCCCLVKYSIPIALIAYSAIIVLLWSFQRWNLNIKK